MVLQLFHRFLPLLLGGVLLQTPLVVSRAQVTTSITPDVTLGTTVTQAGEAQIHEDLQVLIPMDISKENLFQSIYQTLYQRKPTTHSRPLRPTVPEQVIHFYNKAIEYTVPEGQRGSVSHGIP